MSEATLHRWTHEDLARLPEDGKRYEIIDGELFMTAAPSTRHQRILAWLIRTVGVFVEDNDLGELYPAPVDVKLSVRGVDDPVLGHAGLLEQGALDRPGCRSFGDRAAPCEQPDDCARAAS